MFDKETIAAIQDQMVMSKLKGGITVYKNNQNPDLPTIVIVKGVPVELRHFSLIAMKSLAGMGVQEFDETKTDTLALWDAIGFKNPGKSPELVIKANIEAVAKGEDAEEDPKAFISYSSVDYLPLMKEIHQLLIEN